MAEAIGTASGQIKVHMGRANKLHPSAWLILIVIARRCQAVDKSLATSTASVCRPFLTVLSEKICNNYSSTVLSTIASAPRLDPTIPSCIAGSQPARPVMTRETEFVSFLTS